jgi:predicted DNA-binding transcriptional regulator YafY
MNRVDRLLALILCLQARRVTTAEELAGRFGLTVRTIYRDMAALGQAGVPIVSEAGVGYSLMRGWHLPPVNFSAEEASALVTGALFVEQFADASVAAQMRSAVLKVRAVLPRDYQERVARLERGLATTAHAEAPLQENLALLQQALAEQRVLRFAYQGAGKPEAVSRVAEPHGFIHYLARWHLIAWCCASGAFRDFRTDRITQVRMLPETFALRAGFSLAEYIRTHMPAPRLRGRVRFSPLGADRAKREWWMGIVGEETERDGVVLTLAAVEWDRLIYWLLSFGEDATVIGPASLRKKMAEAARKVAAHHAKAS